MSQDKIPPLKVRIVWLILYFIPVGLLALTVYGFLQSWYWGLLALYILPPILNRIIFALLKIREGTFPAKSKEFFAWFLSYQFQTIFLRFPFLEEVIRMVPRLYSVWLRLWGSKIGTAVTWSPGVLVLDRGLVEVGDYTLFGYGSRLASHFFVSKPDGEFELVLGVPKIGRRVILGGESGVAPGAIVGDYEMLPATFDLAPFYMWKNGRRQSNKTDSNKTGVP